MIGDENAYGDENSEKTFKYATIEDFLNNKPLDIDVDLTTGADKIELVFDKPGYDLAFISFNENVLSRITELQKFFQTKHGFATHVILLSSSSKLKSAIKDLKLHKITYAIVVYDNSFTSNSWDLYILYPIIEVQKNMTLFDLDKLVTDDAGNFCDQVKWLKKNSKKNPHHLNDKGQELFEISDEIRYYLCLLADHRMLDVNELEELNDYLIYRRGLLEKNLPMNIDERPLEAERQNPSKYYYYELKNPSDRDVTAANNPINSLSNLIGPSPSFTTIPVPNIPLPSTPFKPCEPKTILKSQTIKNHFSTVADRIDFTATIRAQQKFVSYGPIQNKNDCQLHSSQLDNSIKIVFKDSDYMKAVIAEQNDDVISLSSGESTSPRLVDLVDISPSTVSRSIKCEKDKRKLSEEEDSPHPAKIPNILPHPKPTVSIVSNSPESLLNLFRLVLSIVPLNLPQDNVILTILTNSCNDLQEGILVPSLRVVKIDYDCCKTNGVNEIFEGIHAIYSDFKKSIDHSTDLDYIWNKYFPDRITNFNLLIAFYRFIKLLLLYKLWKNQTDCMKKISTILENVNAVVNFNFHLPTLLDENHLNCFPNTFNKHLQNCQQLHTLYLSLSKEEKIKLADPTKKLDRCINQSKMEYVMGPLLNYFINTLNSIHQQMTVVQMNNTYAAIRALRFCLREIFPLKSIATVFTIHKEFDSSPEKHSSYCKDISDELKLLLEEVKYYQSVLFTSLHYEFVNCLLDFSLCIEEIMNSDNFMSASKLDSLVVLDPSQFAQSFFTSSDTVYQYHPDTEINVLKNALKDNWTHTIYHAFKGTPTDRNAKRIIKEINVLLPILWGLKTFDEALIEAIKLYYSDWTIIAQNDRSGWYDKFSQTKVNCIVWLSQHLLPYTKAIEEIQRYENMLKNEFL